MKKENKTFPITFRKGQKQDIQEWYQEFENLESLQNYLRIKFIRQVALRTYLGSLQRMFTIKSFLSPGEITQQHYQWLLESSEEEARFIAVREPEPNVENLTRSVF